jgi:hypothetical protein
LAQRNAKIHGKQSRKEGQDSATERARTALTALYEKAPHLLEADRKFFDDTPLEERLKAPTKVIRDWVTTHKPVVKAGLWRASEHDRLHNRDIRDFLEVVPRDQVNCSSDDDDEDYCTDDMVETSDEGSSSSECSSSTDDGRSVDSTSSSSSSTGAEENGAKEQQQQGLMKLVEQKITNFFRRKPREQKERLPTISPAPQRTQQLPERNHRTYYTTRIYHYFRRRPPNAANEQPTGDGELT